jgi:hypothetical protein
MMKPKELAQAIMFLTCVSESLGSNLGWNADYREIILGFTQSLQENSGIFS